MDDNLKEITLAENQKDNTINEIIKEFMKL